MNIEAAKAVLNEMEGVSGDMYDGSLTMHEDNFHDYARRIREALSAALEQVNKVYDILSRPCVVIEEALQGCREARGVLIPAVAAPLRNCDLGTAEEQWQRYCKFTDRYNPCSYKGYARCAEDCPIHKKLTQEGHGELLCQLEWAQMPYEEGGEK